MLLKEPLHGVARFLISPPDGFCMSPDKNLQEVIERQLYGLLTAGLPIAVFNLRRIRNFACATGWLAETASLNAVLDPSSPGWNRLVIGSEARRHDS